MTARPESKLLRVAIVGCGKIADQHVLACRRIAGCEIAALCDREVLMAGQLGGRFGIKARFQDATEMLRAVKPDAVHITTPPQSHFALAKLCLEAGSHVYLEKPFTVTAPEADEIIRLAEARGQSLLRIFNSKYRAAIAEVKGDRKCDGPVRGHPKNRAIAGCAALNGDAIEVAIASLH